jgi:hypothetical protein
VETKSRKRIQLFSLALFTIIVIIAGIPAWLSHTYMERLQKELPARVSKATNGAYTATVKDLDVNLLTMSVEGEELNVHPTNVNIPKNSYVISIPKLRLGGINIVKLMFSKKLSSTELLIKDANINIIQNQNIIDTIDKNAKPTPPLLSFEIDKITLAKAHIKYTSIKGADTTYAEINNASAELNNWAYNKDEEENQGFLYARRGRIGVEQLQTKSSGSLYETKAEQITFDSKDGVASAKNISILPMVDSIEFNRRTGHQKDCFQLRFPYIKITGIDWKRALANETIIAANAEIRDASIKDYLDRRMPETGTSKMGNYPHQLIQHVKPTMYLKELKVVNGYVSYSEMNPETDMVGKISFSRINGTIRNVTNVKDSLQKSKTMTADLRALFNGGAETHALFTFNMAADNGEFTVQAKMRNVTHEQVYQPFVALGKVAVNSLNVSDVDIAIKGNDLGADGAIKMLYNNLKLTVQKKDEDNGNRLKGRWLVSFIANKVLMYPNNPMPDEGIRTATFHVDRNPTGSFFNLVWMSLFMGMQKTIARDSSLPEALLN